MPVVSESDLLHLVSIGVLPPKELCSWRICRGVTVPTEDTHESVVYVPFLLCGLALPVSPFFRGLLDFSLLNLTHLNPNSILQISIFVHLCEAFLGILPHFGLWKYLYHCRPGMAGGQHQLVGGASLEMRRGRKTDYLDIPLKDSIKGWRLEWFIVENHGDSLPPRLGRQPDVRTPSWTESPTDQDVAEAGVLLAEVGLLKERGLTAEAVVADFVFKNIQPLKDRAYSAYLYRGLADSTRVTNRRIPAMDLVSQLEMILRGKVSNVGAPVAYSAWNLPPSKTFTQFVSNPPAGDGGLGLRVRPSAEEVSALVALLGEVSDDERQVHFEVPLDPSDGEISAMLDMLAEDSSDTALLEHWQWRLSQKLVKPWTFRGLPVLARNALAEPVNLLLLLMGRKRRKDVFAVCLAWIGMLVLRLLLLRKCPCLNLLMLIPMGVTNLVLTPLGVLSVLLMKMRRKKKMKSL
jgi:hypothetical protein